MTAPPPTPPTHWLAKLIFFTVLAFVMFMALNPAPPREVQTDWDKVNHALAFFGLMTTACYAFAHERTSRRAGIALILLGVGAAIEVAQLYVPGRSAEWGDLWADAVGIALGWLVMAWLRALQRHAA